MTEKAHARAGVFYALAAFTAWGLAPLYWKTLHAVPAHETLAHRVLWSFACLAILLTTSRRWQALRSAFLDLRTFATLACTTFLIGLNWFLFVLAINENRVLEASLGYFINPLVNVILGVTFLRERLRAGQIAAVVLAAAGVAVLTVRYGRLPIFALSLAVSFGFYGLLRKMTRADALVGLTVEVMLLVPLALMYVLQRASSDSAEVFRSSTEGLLLVLAGPITVLPLLWFTRAARRLRYVTIGLLQYLAPTGQFLLATLYYHEPFTRSHMAAFALIWTGLGIYTVEARR